MKRIYASVLLLIIAIAIHAQEIKFPADVYDFLENTKIFELNQVDGHVPVVPYLTAEEALKNNRSSAGSIVSLNGTWKFHFADTPEGTPSGFFTEDYNDKK